MWTGWKVIEQGITSAGAAVGTPAGASIIQGVINQLNSNHQYASVANGALTQLEVEFANPTPQSVNAAMFTLQTLEQMIINGQLPQSVQPFVEELMNPAIQSNPSAVANAIASIKDKLGSS